MPQCNLIENNQKYTRRFASTIHRSKYNIYSLHIQSNHVLLCIYGAHYVYITRLME